ncbi:MAG: hypothetical protein CVU17_04270 [Betaproteobacteria bacterium HGW-Betaproteobacteria-11]|nr:MAG: hypothetical protein CVU17_04270 [Betaproteobacteria bacterium HGW-Betaproteobacteria-11]
MIVWAGISVLSWLWGQAPGVADTGKRAAEIALGQAEQVIPGIKKQIEDAIPGIKEQITTRVVSRAPVIGRKLLQQRGRASVTVTQKAPTWLNRG